MTQWLPVLNGHPDQLRTLADSLVGSATRLSAVNTVLLSLRAGARWDSEAGHSFESAVQEPPPVIAAVVERYAGAARALRTLADELEEAQRDVTEAISSHGEAWRRHRVFLDRRGFSVDPVEQQDLERAMTTEVALADEAERRHTAAVHRHMEADRRCARTLHALARDTVDDTAAYTWTVTTGKVSGPLAVVGGFLPGPLKLVGVAGTAGGVLSQVGLLVLYDEGSWKEVGVNLLGSAVSSLGSVLVAGARVGGTVVINGGRRVFTKTANPTTGYRVGAGARSTFDEWVDSGRGKLGLPVATRGVQIPSRRLPPADSLLDKARNRAVTKVDKAVLDSWRLATANGPQAQRMFVAGVSLQQAPKVVNQVHGVHDRLTQPSGESRHELSPAPPVTLTPSVSRP